MKKLFLIFTTCLLGECFVSCLAGQSLNYEEHIKPILRTRCLNCHNFDDQEADLDLASFEALMKGGSSGPVVNAGRPENSQLFRAIVHAENVEPMPPDSEKIPAAEIEQINQWIRGGLIAGKGGKSQLRSVSLADPIGELVVSPMPESVPEVAVAKTVRPPAPVALAVSPGASLFATSGEAQVFLYGAKIIGQDEMVVEQDAIGSDGRAPYQLLGVLPFPEGVIHDLKFSRNGTLLLAAGGRGAHSGKVVLFDVKTGGRTAEFGDEVDSVLAADISCDHRFVAIGNSKKVVKIFDARSGEPLHRIDKHTDWITAIAFSPDGKLLATADRSGGLHVWESDTGLPVFALDEHKVQINELIWRSDSKVLGSVAEDGNLVVWNMKDGFPVLNVAAHNAKSDSRYTRRTGVTGAGFAADGSVVTSGRGGWVRIWSATGQKMTEFSATPLIPTQVGLLDHDETVVATTLNGQIRIYDRKTEKLVQNLTNGG